jgi:hypothetical protein
MQPQNQQLDQDVVNLTKAIRQVESGGDLNARGASGEFGGYQFMPDTWNKYSKEFGVNVPLEQATREQQNQVAYMKVKRWKDEGYNIGQVASMWNAGAGRPDAYQQGWRGTNDQGVQFDTPAYAQKVAEAYQGIKTGGLGGNYTQPPQTTEFTPAAMSGAETVQQQMGMEPEGLISKLGQSFAEGGQGIGQAYEKAATGDIRIGSGILQGAGAGAGVAGDVIDDTISSVPLVGDAYEGITGFVGGMLGAGAEQSGLADWFSGLKPETQDNIGAAMNVASVVPFFRALKYGRQGVGDARTAATMESTQVNAAKELEASLNKPQRRILDRAQGRGLDPMGAIVTNQNYLPDVIERNGKYYWDTKQAAQAVQRDLDADELALQNLLESTRSNAPGAAGLAFNINDIARKTTKDVMDKAGRTGNFGALQTALTKYFDDYKQSMQGVEFIDLPELNAIKRDIRSAINFDAVDPTGTLAKQAKFDAGQSLMRQVEEAAKKAGVEGVKDLNNAMGTKLTALDILDHLGDGKAIKSGPDGLVKSLSKETPIVAGLVDYASRGVPSTPTTRLARKRPLPETARKGLVQLGAGLGLSGQLTSGE